MTLPGAVTRSVDFFRFGGGHGCASSAMSTLEPDSPLGGSFLAGAVAARVRFFGGSGRSSPKLISLSLSLSDSFLAFGLAQGRGV